MESININRTHQTTSIKHNLESTKVDTINTASKSESDSVTMIFRDYQSPQQILNQKIIASLNGEIIAVGGAEIESLDRNDFTPRKVAERILSFIESALSQLADGNDKKRQDLLEQARGGVESGSRDVREILFGLGVLLGEIETDINQTYDFIMDGLDALLED
ncbi:MAG: DUF5610 domain-containing protein [Proteobacteria bacterium]|nr:DUF5610 domain-containing protein [Pseudomonadota bacterium]